MDNTNKDQLLQWGLSAGDPLTNQATPPEGKTPEHPQENDSSSISEFEEQVKEAHRAAYRGSLKTHQDIAALKHCLRWHSTTTTDCLGPDVDLSAVEAAEKAVTDIQARGKDTPLPRSEKRLLKRYRAAARKADLEAWEPFVGQWRECTRCNP